MRTLRARRGPGVLRLRIVMIICQHMACWCDIFVSVKLLEQVSVEILIHFACMPLHVFQLVILSSHCSYHFCLFSLSSPFQPSFLPSSLLFFASSPNIFYPFHHSPSLRFSSRSVRSYNPDYLTASAFSIARPGWINIIDHISESPSNWCCVCVFAVVCMHEFTCVYTLNVCLHINFMLVTVCTH